MTAWVFLLSWAMLVAELLRTGSTIPYREGHLVQRGSLFVMDHSKLRARVRACVLAAFAVAPLVFLFTVRRDVGVDYPNYVEMFEQFRSGAALPRIEPLYGLLNRTMAPLGSLGVLAVFAVAASLAALPLFYRVFRSSLMPWLGILILFGLGIPFFITNGVRAAIAVGIVMLVLPVICRRQLVAWTLGILFAAGFHFTALFVWPLYWIVHLAWPRILMLVGLAAAVVLSMNQGLAVSFLQWAPVVLPSKYAHYPDKVLEHQVAYEFGFGYLIYISLACLILLVWDRAQDEGGEIRMFRNVAILGLEMAIGLYQFWAVNRLALFFIPALTIFLPWVIMRCVDRRERVLWAAGLTALFGMMFARGLWVGAHGAVPYLWIF